MNKDVFKGKWEQWKGQAKSKWGELTDDDLLQVQGDAQRLAGLLQERYGHTKERAQQEIQDFYDRNN
ncbi:CsbD family protein [Alcaligenes endophyticus]|uniref:CsbD family protein n=1 Tax=Alcaligenes endophyticus TaxID=1929088 RepID=A0ABT8ELV2_9BURK|nr:CsbD family protein [Alcaligenes endophyticus]MCX5591145.1 CsbD family protein [Alcaligenes endophyticus]MDN4122277.1 CsbD family protein [Alcaligenes endophyticus]